MKQGLTVLGSTGSIGVNTLDVVARHPDRFEIVALTAASQVDALLAIVDRHAPALGAEGRDRFAAIWLQGCRYEWRFWDAAWRGEAWPV